jgi:hypothetical protein
MLGVLGVLAVQSRIQGVHAHLTRQTGRVFLAAKMESPMPDGKKTARSARPAKPRLSSRKVNTATCVAGLTTAGIGLVGVLTRAGGAFDMVLLLAGLLLTLVGLILRGRSPRT